MDTQQKLRPVPECGSAPAVELTLGQTSGAGEFPR